jgi:hypothetical protein
LNLQDRTFFVVDQDIAHPIVGHSELAELGLDPQSTLDRLRFSRDTGDDIKPALEGTMINETSSLALAEYWWKKLCSLVREYKDIFRVQLLDDPPAKVTPMDVKYNPEKESTTWISYNRKYAQEEVSLLKEHIQSLEKNGFVYRNPHARFASPATWLQKMC